MVILFATNIYFYTENKAKQLKIINTEHQLVQQKQTNLLLNEQLEQANKRVFEYLQQTKVLQEKVLHQLQYKQEKTNEILQILSKHKNWANNAIPDDVSRLFNAANFPDKTKPNTLPNRTAMPNSASKYKTKR